MTMDELPRLKPLRWIGSSRRDQQALPGPLKICLDLLFASLRLGEEARAGQPAKRGFGSVGVLEVTEDWFKSAVFVLLVLQKRSTRGRATPKARYGSDPARGWTISQIGRQFSLHQHARAVSMAELGYTLHEPSSTATSRTSPCFFMAIAPA